MKCHQGCKYAQWERTVSGKLHPSGRGVCTFQVKVPTLPASMRYHGGIIFGGGINRRRPFDEECPTFAHEEPKK